jgi:hypothetical protein
MADLDYVSGVMRQSDVDSAPTPTPAVPQQFAPVRVCPPVRKRRVRWLRDARPAHDLVDLIVNPQRPTASSRTCSIAA